MKNGKTTEVVVDDPEQAFKRFEGALRQALTVSKKEILRREKKWKADRRRSRSRAHSR
jgi:hypothetical protein